MRCPAPVRGASDLLGPANDACICVDLSFSGGLSEMSGAAHSSNREYVLETPGDNLVLTGAHHPDGDMKQTFTAPRDRDRRFPLHQLPDDLSSVEPERILRPSEAQVGDSVGDRW